MKLFLLTAFGICLSAFAQDVPTVGESLRLDLEIIRIEAGVPGISVGFVRVDGTLGALAVGMANRETRQPLQVNDRFLAASIGKTFTSATTLLLATEGQLDLDGLLKSYIGHEPWFARLPSCDLLSIRHLLNHSSGLPDHVHLPSFHQALQKRGIDAPPFNCTELVSFILDHPPLFAPGEGWHYSDTNYILLGMVLETVIGDSLYREVEKRFLNPLDLQNIQPSNERRLPGLVPGYAGQNPFGIPHVSLDSSGLMRWHPGIERWGGGWMTTAGDLAQWGHALFTGKALPSGTQSNLFDTVPTADTADAPRYGAGIVYQSGRLFGPSWGHGGWVPGYVSSLRYYSDHQLTVAIQVNTDAPSGWSGDDWLNTLEKRVTDLLLHL